MVGVQRHYLSYLQHSTLAITDGAIYLMVGGTLPLLCSGGIATCPPASHAARAASCTLHVHRCCAGWRSCATSWSRTGPRSSARTSRCRCTSPSRRAQRVWGVAAMEKSALLGHVVWWRRRGGTRFGVCGRRPRVATLRRARPRALVWVFALGLRLWTSNICPEACLNPPLRPCFRR